MGHKAVDPASRQGSFDRGLHQAGSIADERSPPRMFAEKWNSPQRPNGKPGLRRQPIEVLGAGVIALGKWRKAR